MSSVTYCYTHGMKQGPGELLSLYAFFHMVSQTRSSADANKLVRRV